MYGYNDGYMNEYVPIKIPRALADEMDKIVGTMGYTSRGEIAKDAIRRFLDKKHDREAV